MTRKRDLHNSDQSANEDRPVPETAEPAPDSPDAAAESVAAASEVLPTEADLEARGFTPDEVRKLVLISVRDAGSEETRAAEAQLRRLRFTRWLVERGVLDEWSA
jgi:hypothetical protein